jgi:hypothetical protein
MTSIIDNMQDLPGNPLHRTGKPVGEAQHNAWLLQLEQAWMANLGTRHGNAEPDRTNSDTVREIARTMQTHAVTRGNPVLAVMEPSSVSTDMRSGGTSNGNGEPLLDHAQEQDTAPLRNAADSTFKSASEAPPSERPVAVNANKQIVATSSALHIPPDSSLGEAPNLYKALVPGGEVLPSMMAQPARTASAVAEPAGTANVTAIPTVDRLRQWVPASWISASGDDALPANDIGLDGKEDDPGNENKPAGEAASEDQYTARNLHLYQDGNTVQAWLRDAELSEIGAYSVAQALQSELQRSALQLTALTVNGKRLPFTPTQEEDGADTMPVSTQERVSRDKSKTIQNVGKTANNNGGVTHGD